VTQRLVLQALAEARDREADTRFRWRPVVAITHRRFCEGALTWDGDDFEGRWVCDRCDTDREPSPADLESVRRAVRTLARSGAVEVAHFHQACEVRWRRRWTREIGWTARKMLCARLPLSVEEAEAERLAQRLADERLVTALASIGESPAA
jgi:hypothetical protein